MYNAEMAEDRAHKKRIRLSPKEEVAKTISKWGDSQIGQLLLGATRFLYDLEAREHAHIAGSEFMTSAKAALKPIPVNTFESPLRTVIDTMRAVAQESPERFHGALVWLLRRPTSVLPLDDLSKLLQLLARMEISNAEFVANLALQRINDTRGAVADEESICEALVYLCGTSSGAPACLFMVESLLEKRLPCRLAAEAALRMIAAVEPSQLSLGFRSLRRIIEDENDCPDLNIVLEDVLARAKPTAFLTALTSLNPEQHLRLFRASIGRAEEDRALFVLGRGGSLVNHRRNLFLLRDGSVFSLTDYILPGIGKLVPEEWTSILIRTLNFAPKQMHLRVVHSTSSIVAFAQTEDVDAVETEDVDTIDSDDLDAVGPMERGFQERLRPRYAQT